MTEAVAAPAATMQPAYREENAVITVQAGTCCHLPVDLTVLPNEVHLEYSFQGKAIKFGVEFCTPQQPVKELVPVALASPKRLVLEFKHAGVCRFVFDNNEAWFGSTQVTYTLEVRCDATSLAQHRAVSKIQALTRMCRTRQQYRRACDDNTPATPPGRRPGEAEAEALRARLTTLRSRQRELDQAALACRSDLATAHAHHATATAELLSAKAAQAATKEGELAARRKLLQLQGESEKDATTAVAEPRNFPPPATASSPVDALLELRVSVV